VSFVFALTELILTTPTIFDIYPTLQSLNSIHVNIGAPLAAFETALHELSAVDITVLSLYVRSHGKRGRFGLQNDRTLRHL
jgi:hypothetical protein